MSVCVRVFLCVGGRWCFLQPEIGLHGWEGAFTLSRAVRIGKEAVKDRNRDQQ